MASESNPNPNSALEESWVVSELDDSAVIVQNNEAAPLASLSSENLTPTSSYSESDLIQGYSEHAASSSTGNLRNLTESTATLASSASSGPELIMPSIMFESRASEHGSWVIPRKRSKQSLYESRKAPRLSSSSRSHASAHEQDPHHHHNRAKKASKPSSLAAAKAGVGAAAGDAAPALGYFTQLRNMLTRNFQQYEFFRLLLNALLVLMVMHLLVFPELVHQAPAVCQVSAVSKIYSHTCARHNRNISTSTAHLQAAIRTQNQLQIYLNQTIEEIAPVDSSLKDSDNILRGVYIDIRTEYGSARHEVELEFEGVWAASRAIARALTNLKLDIKATVDGFRMPTHRLDSIIKGDNHHHTSGNMFSRFFSSRRPSDLDTQEANGIAAISQFERLTHELDLAIARLAHKTDTLLRRLANLDDHLQSIRTLIVREQQRIRSQGLDGTTSQEEETVWTTLSGFIHGSKSSSQAEENDQAHNILVDLDRISSYHGRMADVVGKLDTELKALQKIRAIRT